jgi:hypothetical protein
MNADVWMSRGGVELLPQWTNDGDRRLWISVSLSWSRTDRHAIKATFFGGSQKKDTEWLLGRELLADGLNYPVGYGDVFISPDPSDEGFVLLVLEYATRVGVRLPVHFLTNFLAAVAEDELQSRTDRGVIR